KHVLATSHTKAQKEALQQQVREGEAIEHVEPNAHNNLNMNNDSEPFQIPTIQRAALPEYLHWLCDRNSNYYQFYNPPGGLPQFDRTKPMLGVQDCQALMALYCHHFLCHPLFPSIIWENGVPV